MKSIETNQQLGNITYDDARQLTELTNQCTVSLIFSKITQDIRSSARRIFDGGLRSASVRAVQTSTGRLAPVATARKFNEADVRIDK